jgi:N-acetylneuraminic acid mutarotase
MLDADRNEWHTIAKMNVKRQGHSATTLANGHVIVAGGWDDRSKSVRSAEMYDASANKWVSIDDMIDAHGYHAAAAQNDTVYVLGGRDEKGKVVWTAERYDEARHKWQRVAALLCARWRHAATTYGVSDDGQKVCT